MPEDEERFAPGDRVRVLTERAGGNPRTPHYLRGHVGVVTERHGVIVNPLDHHYPYPPLYSVAFRVQDLDGPAGPDMVIADLHDEWLEPA
jgi:hypothetical protein